MHIEDLHAEDEAGIAAAAALLVEGFREHWPAAWPTLDDAVEEVREALAPGLICRVAYDDDNRAMVGWIGARPEYRGHVWELHPLVVRYDRHRQGIGRALVRDLEAQVAVRGGLTILLGSDDEAGMTSLAGEDLYPDPLQPLAAIRNLRGHPYEFYQRCGFAVVGVVPDANGPGKPDILMAKRVKPEGRRG